MKDKKMIVDKHQQFIQGVTKLFEGLHFDLSTPLLGCGGCFDVIAKKRSLLMLVKIIETIDNLREDQAYELRKLSSMLGGLPLIVGRSIRSNSTIEDGVVYSRYEIPVVSLETLRNLLLHKIPPLIFAYRGGFKVKFDGDLLKEKRIGKNLSLSDLAREVGISKRAVYEYERGKINVSLETAMMIEEFLDEPLTLAINLFDEMQRIGSVTQPEKYSGAPKSDLEKDVKKHFDALGMKDQLWTKKFPFRVLAKSVDKNDELEKSITTITGITRKPIGKDFTKKILVTYNVSRIADANPLVVVGSEIDQKEFKGVPILSIDELTKLKKKKDADKK